MPPARHTLRGVIVSAGFRSRDRIVVGRWTESPIGPMNDLMWARPDGSRVLVAPEQRIADFVTSIYEFDEVRVAPLEIESTPRTLYAKCEGLEIRLQAGIPIPIPFGSIRSPKFTRYVEAPIARVLLGVHAHGVNERGVEEWYQADEYRRVVNGRASLHGMDLGVLAPMEPPMKIGVSEPPQRPSFVQLRPMLFDGSGALDAVLERSQSI